MTAKTEKKHEEMKETKKDTHTKECKSSGSCKTDKK